MPATEKAEAVETVIDRITTISTLPTVALKIVETVQDPDAGAKELMQAVQADPSLTMRVLRAVNSAAYGLSVRVTNLQQAISFLGFSQIRNLALTASVAEAFRGGDDIGTYSRIGLWRHMVAVAVGARLIARRISLEDFEDAFLAGLLHDVGIIMEDQYLHDEFAQVVAAVKEGTSPCATERAILGFDHARVGEHAARKWNFPERLRLAIGSHHRSHQVTGDHARFVQCVEAANVLCTLKGFSSVGVKTVQAEVAVFQALGLDMLALKVLAQDLDGAIEQHESLFSLL